MTDYSYEWCLPRGPLEDGPEMDAFEAWGWQQMGRDLLQAIDQFTDFSRAWAAAEIPRAVVAIEKMADATRAFAAAEGPRVTAALDQFAEREAQRRETALKERRADD